MFEFSNVCRICLTATDQNENIYDSTSPSYKDMIKEFLGLDIHQQEDLPDKICNICSSEFLIVVKFVTKCKSSCKKLLNGLEIKATADTIKEEDLPLSILLSKEEEINSTSIKEELLLNADIKIENTDDIYSDADVHFESDNNFEIVEKVKEVKKSKVKIKVKKPKSVVKRVRGNPLQCKSCDKVLKNIELLKKHQERHEGDSAFVCSHCGRRFKLKCTLTEHIGRIHMRTATLSRKSCICDLCGKICFRKNDLTIHMRSHTKEKPYRCTLCGLSFSQGGSLRHHMRRHTGEKPYSCQVCGKAFVSQSSRSSHMIVHCEEKKFICQVCNKALKTSKGLRQHLLLHASHKPNVCEVCGAAFAQKVNLRTHIKAKHSEHSGTCEVCKKTFSNVSEHMRIHTGEKPFTCNLCGKGFPRQRHLTTHLRRHRESTKFACAHDKCNAAFPMQCQLDFHVMKFHTKHFPFLCDGCNKGFYRLADLNKHINASNCKKIRQKDVITKQ